jgi:hypothetical protein
MILSEKLYLTEDRKTVVPEGDKRAAFLLGIPGTRINDNLAKSLGLIPEPEALINQVTVNVPEITSSDPAPINRDFQPKRRGRPPRII